MKEAAARAGDLTKDGTPLGPGLGSPNVSIGGQPAWRAFVDFHSCPKSEGPKPHVGGVVLRGSGKVSINRFPAVRRNDMVIEIGPPNAITGGFQKVQIGD
jgi:uncharacterized Zn-binding protein involved in type VI secretion